MVFNSLTEIMISLEGMNESLNDICHFRRLWSDSRSSSSNWLIFSQAYATSETKVTERDSATHTAGCPASIQRLYRLKNLQKFGSRMFKTFLPSFFAAWFFGPHFWTGLFGFFLETKLKFCVGSHHSPRFHLASQSWPHPELHLPPA